MFVTFRKAEFGFCLQIKINIFALESAFESLVYGSGSKRDRSASTKFPNKTKLIPWFGFDWSGREAFRFRKWYIFVFIQISELIFRT